MCQRRMQAKNHKGFTVMESMVVVLIMAIAAVVVIPSITGAGGIDATSAARIVAADLQYAQNVAITDQDPVTVTFNAAGESYSLTNASGALIHPMSKSAYTVAFASMSGFESVDISSPNFAGGAVVTFDEIGSPSNAGSVTIQVGPHAYRIDVAVATGKVTVTCVGS